MHLKFIPFSDRINQQGEQITEKVTGFLFEQPLFQNAVSGAFALRQRAERLQSTAMGMLSMPSHDDVERLIRRLRVLGQRVEALENTLVNSPEYQTLTKRLDAIEKQLQTIIVRKNSAAAKPTTASSASSKAKRKPAARKAATRPRATKK